MSRILFEFDTVAAQQKKLEELLEKLRETETKAYDETLGTLKNGWNEFGSDLFHEKAAGGRAQFDTLLQTVEQAVTEVEKARARAERIEREAEEIAENRIY